MSRFVVIIGVVLSLAAIATYSLLPVEEDTDVTLEPSANSNKSVAD